MLDNSVLPREVLRHGAYVCLRLAATTRLADLRGQRFPDRLELVGGHCLGHVGAEHRFFHGVGRRQVEQNEIDAARRIRRGFRGHRARGLRGLHLRCHDVVHAHRIPQRHQALHHGEPHEANADVSQGWLHAMS